MRAEAGAPRGGMLVVVSGPSGVGKSTVVNAVLTRDRHLVRSVSLTTRPARAREREGHDYQFVTPEAFDRCRDEGALLEWAEVHGYWYGTPRSFVERHLAAGKVVLLALDPQGARTMRAQARTAVSVFLVPPSWDALRDRLRARGTEVPDALERRLHNAYAELGRAREYEYVVLNDRVEHAVQTLHAIIIAEQCRSHRWQPLAIPPATD